MVAMNHIACMGGWCIWRDRCRLHQNTAAPVVAERLCEPGTNDSYEPVRIVRQPGSWERGSRGVLAPAMWTEPIH